MAPACCELFRLAAKGVIPCPSILTQGSRRAAGSCSAAGPPAAGASPRPRGRRASAARPLRSGSPAPGVASRCPTARASRAGLPGSCSRRSRTASARCAPRCCRAVRPRREDERARAHLPNSRCTQRSKLCSPLLKGGRAT